MALGATKNRRAERANSARVGQASLWLWVQQRTGARSVQTAPGLDRLVCGFGRSKEQARGACKQRPGWTG
ncbi:hypothetical protein DPQ22_05765 [Candidatus Tokpelaia sp.]|nr:hypothetical protein DPQ22_05765 [Candidatus Tokpelaia sp.]